MSTVKSLMGRSHPSFTSGKPKFGASKVSMPKKANEQSGELRRIWKKK